MQHFAHNDATNAPLAPPSTTIGPPNAPLGGPNALFVFVKTLFAGTNATFGLPNGVFGGTNGTFGRSNGTFGRPKGLFGGLNEVAGTERTLRECSEVVSMREHSQAALAMVLSAATSAIFGTRHADFESSQMISASRQVKLDEKRGSNCYARHGKKMRVDAVLTAMTLLLASVGLSKQVSAQSCPLSTGTGFIYAGNNLTCLRLGPGSCCFGPNFYGQQPIFVSAQTGYCFPCGGYTVTVVIGATPDGSCPEQTQRVYIRSCGTARWALTYARIRRDLQNVKVQFRIRTKAVVLGVRGFVPGSVELFRYAQPGQQYRWRRVETNALVLNGPQPSGSVASGADSAHLTISDIDTPDEGLYVLEALDSGGGYLGMFDAVRVYVDRPVADIISMPQDREACLGGSTEFLVIANEPSGVPASYRWYRNGVTITDGALGGIGTVSGATTPLLSISNLEAGAAGDYACQILTGEYVNNTFDAVLTVSDNTTPPVVLEPPQSVSVDAEQSAYMIADIDVATGQVPSFQWRKDGAAIFDDGRIEGTQTEQLVFNRVVTGDAGQYDCIVTRGCASTTTAAATLTVTTPVACDSIDFNNDTSLFDPIDIDAFLSVYGEGPCIPSGATCNDIDFNNDTSLFDPCDIDSFLTVYSEGPCTPCGT